MTLTDIANLALGGMGAKTIASLDDTDVNARKMKVQLPVTIETISAKFPWLCLRRNIKLVHTVEAALDGHNQFLSPKNLLEIIRAYPIQEYEREGQYILSRAETLFIKCTICSYNPSEWDVNLRKAIVAQLKADTAASILGDAGLAANFTQTALREIQAAETDDIYNQRNKRMRSPIPVGFMDFDMYI